MFADDMAAEADSLGELFEIYKALVTALNKAGIQVKASKVEFRVEEITFHNYRIVGGFHVESFHVESLILDRPLYIWNKDNSNHLFIEVDRSDEGWGARAYQYASAVLKNVK